MWVENAVCIKKKPLDFNDVVQALLNRAAQTKEH